jgi:2'-5' RNA ligase
MDPACNGGDGQPCFALVIYIPAPLSTFLDDLRRELVPHYSPHAHVSVLPPRPLAGTLEVAIEQARSAVRAFEPFDIQPGEVKLFPKTNVIHLPLRSGDAELRRMHRYLNRESLRYREPYSYEPHITLAQDLDPAHVQELANLARRRWAEYPYRKVFRAEAVTFVRHAGGTEWIDLAEFALGAVAV